MIDSVVTVISSFLFNINNGILMLEETSRSLSSPLILQMEGIQGQGKMWLVSLRAVARTSRTSAQ